jgi:hypothetical protein
LSMLVFLSLTFAACGRSSVPFTNIQATQAPITRTTQEGQAHNLVRHSLYQRREPLLLHRLVILSSRWMPRRGPPLASTLPRPVRITPCRSGTR